MLGGILYTSKYNLKAFDPHARLHDNMRQLSFDNKVKQLLEQKGITTSNTVLHFSDDDCVCNFIAQPHIDSVKVLAEHSAKQNVDVFFADVAEMSDIVPSVPAVAVFDETGNLQYLGPYSTGMYCSPNQGIVEPFIRGKEGGVSSTAGATIIAEARGCYCSVEKSST